MNEQLLSYLERHISAKSDWVMEMEEKAKRDNVPIMDPVGIDFMLNLIKVHQPKRILEIGTAIGYSALRMSEANPTANIITIEKDMERYEEALENIKRRNKASQISVYHGDALDVIKNDLNEKESFDFIFIDAAKGKYQEFFELVHPLLKNSGILVVDNVLFRGYVADPEESPKRFKNMVKKIRTFNEVLTSHPEYVTSILPIGDGVMICFKSIGEEVL